MAALQAPALAQDPIRPWLDWRTIATPHYRLHFTREMSEWAVDVAQRVESIDSAIVRLVGWRPPRPIHVVVDDPFSISNGYALPFVDRPVSVWWALPADPRSEIGNYRTWGEILSVHELAHIAHMTRPSRNPVERYLWTALPANLGPITRKAPRWVIEGYATFVEGRVTGLGRPNGAWRPAILRQWAIEGRLPTYDQLSRWSDFEGGAFAYLGGSAFLEWLTRREGDSSLVHLWRRLTARIDRSFDASFGGVYGDAPALLYGRHTAELTRDAMLAKAELERAGLVEGELVQHRTWGTGDPAVARSGDRVAIVLRERDRPARVEVWSTAPEAEDSLALRRRTEAQRKDPQDVADRRVYPTPKRALKTLEAQNRHSYQEPRWLADNRRVLLARWAPLSDGTLRPDLYVWDPEEGGVERITQGAGLLNADPHPTANEALAMHCHAGHCDIAHVDLGQGIVTTVLEGDARTTYYRPRYSPDGRRFTVSVTDSGHWRVLVADSNGANRRLVDPDDGANRYDAQWLGTDTLVAVSERGGIPNLEVLSIANASSRMLTRVTGAAVAPDVDAKDGSIWFLTLHSRGFDVRRLPRAAALDSNIRISAERFGFAGSQQSTAALLSVNRVEPARPYGTGPRQGRWLPGGYYSADGAGALLTIFSGDIVGRLNATATAAYGQPGTSRGGSVQAVWRYPRPAIEIAGFGLRHEPSRGQAPQAGVDSLDATVVQGMLALVRETQGDGWSIIGRIGGAAGSLDPSLGSTSQSRSLGFGDVAIQWLQSRGATGLVERLRVHTTQGHTRESYQRTVFALAVETTGEDVLPLGASVTYGTLSGRPHPFELFSVGGVSSPVGDSSVLSQRYAMPVFPTGTITGNALLAWSVELPSHPWTLFYESASTAMDVARFANWIRAIGFDTHFLLPPIPVAFAPRIDMRAGAAYTLDEPFPKRVRGFFTVHYAP